VLTSNPLIRGPAGLPLPPFIPRAPWWGGDLQTLRNTLSYRAPDFSAYKAERLRLPLQDGDALLGLLNHPATDSGKPTVILIHGLTGDENSRDIATSAAFHLQRGHPVVRLNLRGAGPSLAFCRAHYHAGRSEDLHIALPALPKDLRARGILLVGVSLGGNMLLKFLAEAPPPYVHAAVAVSAPIDLKRAQACIARRRNLIYHRHLLRQMKHDAAGRTASPALLAEIKTIYDFDDRIVAPANGYAGAEDYYARASAVRQLPAIATPTLLIHAADDPWIPADIYLAREWPQDSAVTLAMSPSGGHVGFHAADDAWPWHDRCAGHFLEMLRI
jgi:predicted alpha/beta-fold hydrolase